MQCNKHPFTKSLQHPTFFSHFAGHLGIADLECAPPEILELSRDSVLDSGLLYFSLTSLNQ